MRLPLSRWAGALAVAAVLLPAAAACGLGGDEDALVIYSGRNEALVKPLLKKLEGSVGTKVEVRYGGSAELAAQLLEEGAKTKADLFLSQDAGALGALSKQGRLEKLPQPSLGKVAEQYRGKAGDWVGVSGRVRVLAYHPAQVPTPPDSVHDLVKPEWKGKVGYAPTNASFQAFVTGMRVLEGDDATRAWLKGLKANGAKPYDNNVNLLSAVDSGEVALGLLNHYYWYERVAEKGAAGVNAKIHFLDSDDPGALINVAGVGVLKGTEHKDAAVKAIGYLLSTEGQQYFADETMEYPVVEGVTTAANLPSLKDMQKSSVDLNKLDSLEATLELLGQVGLT
jgi:iron(III) transport system substrate-binding protein